MNPIVSVIIPVYNQEKYLDECLSSVCGQTLRDIEIMCVNDGSTDESLKILNKYAKNDSRIHVFSQSNHARPLYKYVALLISVLLDSGYELVDVNSL